MNEQLAGAVDASWARSKQAQLRRVAAMEGAIVALLAGALEDDARRLAIGEAHKLAGSLGSFGMAEGSRLAAEIERMWSLDDGRSADPAQLAALVTALRGLVHEHAGYAEQRGLARPVPGSTVDVLVVDDDEVFADFVVETLSSRSYQVCWLPNGESAHTALCGSTASLRARLILLDVEMPGLDGFGLLRQLAKSGVTRQSAVMMLTRRTMADDIVRAHSLGIVDYLAKPLSAPTLAERVDRALEAQAALA
jgi:CheY-like chemotaxis protein/HPt (histidine-containing phosphotransfer) domain-containing protein